MSKTAQLGRTVRGGTRKPETAFINIPYATEYEDRLLSLIAGVSLYGVVPTAAIVAGDDANRLDRIVAAITECTLSIHDLSWMGVDSPSPLTPRFNMPFEFGMAVALASLVANDFVVLDTVPHRLDKALSDARGIDAHIVDDTPLSVFRALANVFHRHDFQPEPRQFQRIHARLRIVAEGLRSRFGFKSMFAPKPFAELRKAAAQLAADVRHESVPTVPLLITRTTR